MRCDLRVEKSGFVLGVVVLSAMVLAIFLFSYNTMVRRQNIRAHHEQIGEVAGMLALAGANLLAEQLQTVGDTFIDAAAASLKNTPETDPFVAPDPTGLLAKTTADYHAYLQTMTELDPLPICRRMEISFDDMQQINPDTTPDQMQQGRDPVEKCGFLNITCAVEYRGLARKARVRRQFRIVSMVPGPFARFTLFVPYTPAINSYNGLGVVYNGRIDPAYTHPFPPGGLQLRAPLKIINGTDSLSVTSPVTTADLGNRGWIFLGPSHDASSEGPVILRIPSGYSNDAGGHFMIARAILNGAGKLVLPPENIIDPAAFALPTTLGVPAAIHGIYQGFFTAEEATPGVITPSPVAAKGFWSLPNPGDSAASWLMPFGENAEPSRTLMVGPVLAGFLKFYMLKEPTLSSTDPAYWSVSIKQKLDSSPDPALIYDKTAQVNAPDAVPPGVPAYQNVFLGAPGDPAGKEGLTNLSRVVPASFLPGMSFAGVAFNALFDFMAYTTTYPGFLTGSAILAGVGMQSLVPASTDLNTTAPPGQHPWESFEIRFREGNDPDDLFFRGNLLDLALTTTNLPGRVSHIVDLSACTSQAEENQLFANTLFAKVTAAEDAAHAGWWKPRRKGVFFIRRRASPGTPLSLPGSGALGILLNQNMMIAVSGGNLAIPCTIQAPLDGGAPGKLLSLVTLDGNIILETSQEVHAYLTALKKGPGGGSGGGKLLCGASNAQRCMNIFGGLAVWELAMYPNDGSTSTTMTGFTNGGKIRYNPRFNPTSPVYAGSREFLPEDKPSSLEITGDD